MCEPGFSTRADFVPFTNSECVVNITTLEVLWGITVFSNFITFCMTLRVIHTVMTRFRLLGAGKPSTESHSTSRSKPQKKQSRDGGEQNQVALVPHAEEQTVNHSPPTNKKETREKIVSYYLKFAILISSTFCSLFLIILGGLKIRDMEVRTIGKDVTASAVYIVVITWFCLFLIFVTIFLVRMQKKNVIVLRANLGNKLALYEKTAIPCTATMIVTCSVPICISVADDGSTQAMSTVFFSMLAFSSCFLGVSTLAMIHIPFITVLQSITRDSNAQVDPHFVSLRQSMEKVLKRAKISACVLTSVVLFCAPLTIVCASLPFMQLRVAYVFPVVSIGASLLQDTAAHFQSG